MNRGAGGPAGVVDGTDVERIEARLTEIVRAPNNGSDAGAAWRLSGYVLEGGGKRIRPLLCLAAWRATSSSPDAEPPDGVLDLACALELVHGYSLVHDDLPSMDDAAVRRGRPAAHRAFGPRAAVIGAAALIPLAGYALERGARSLGLGAAERAALGRDFAAGAGATGMVGGQWLDLDAEAATPALQELEQIHARKTAALLIAAVRLGARAARADARQLAALTAYAGALGLAFQIADDLLDVTGRPAVTGKHAGHDRERDKATFVTVLGVARARRRGLREAGRAIDALACVGLDVPSLVSLARFAIERDR